MGPLKGSSEVIAIVLLKYMATPLFEKSTPLVDISSVDELMSGVIVCAFGVIVQWASCTDITAHLAMSVVVDKSTEVLPFLK